MTEKEIIQKIYEAIKLVDCMQYNPSVDFNYLKAKGAYNIIKNQVEHIEAENAELRATLSKMETVEKELRARLEKAVELPCKVGDTVYEKGMYEGDVYEHRIRKIVFDAEKIAFDCTAIGNSIFLARAEAEARLKEISEKNDDERPKKND